MSGRVAGRNTGDALGNARDSIKLVTGEAGFNDLSVVMQTGVGSDVEGRVSCKLNRLFSPSRLKNKKQKTINQTKTPLTWRYPIILSLLSIHPPILRVSY